MKKKFICTVCGYVYEGEHAPEKCPICGARLTDGGFCPRCDDGAEDLDENAEKHDKLNPKL